MEWSRLLSCARWGQRDVADFGDDEANFFVPATDVLGDERSPFDRDYGRILYSSAFRRLQDKTQVFPLGRNDYVRTRLTHSLEVAHVGASLGRIVGEKLLSRHAELRERGLRAAHFSSIVSAACLAHDIGNPPFGHFGEEAIESALARKNILRKFEGNAQGFRLLTRIGDSMAGKGLKLTAAVLGAFMKYPCTEAFSKSGKGGISAKKFGFISDDVAAARFVAEKTGLLPIEDAGERIAWARHPLAFLTEAADDLSYLVADMEDAFISKIISFDAVSEFLFPLVPEKTRALAKAIAKNESEESAVRYIRAVAVGSGIREICRVFLSREENLLAGTQNASMLDDSCFSDAIKKLRKFSFSEVYNAPAVVEIELMGFRVVEALVEFFFEWVENPLSAKGKKIELAIHGENFSNAPKEARLLHLLDTVSGMTDSFALATYRRLHGI